MLRGDVMHRCLRLVLIPAPLSVWQRHQYPLLFLASSLLFPDPAHLCHVRQYRPLPAASKHIVSMQVKAHIVHAHCYILLHTYAPVCVCVYVCVCMRVYRVSDQEREM